MGGGDILHLECKAKKKEYVIINKTRGKFYTVKGIDAYILGVLLGYKVLDGKRAGFPDNALDKVMLKLEEKEISYHVINENTTFIKKDFNDKNKYNDYYKEALKKIEVGDKVMILLDKVKKSNKKELEKLLEVISEFYN